MSDFQFKIPSFVSLKADSYADAIDASVHAGAARAPDPVVRLDQYWYDAWSALGASGDGHGNLEQLIGAYGEPHRHVRGSEHLLHCLSTLSRWRAETRFFYVVSMALWYHDAVYDPNRHDNEARSARVAMNHLSAAGVAPDLSKAVRDLVIATRPGENASGPDSRLINDIDKSILGADVEAYDRYERGLRAEHHWISDFVYRRRRIEQIQTMLGKNRLFACASAHAECEEPARENLRRWLQTWQDSGQTTAVPTLPGTPVAQTPDLHTLVV